MPSIPLHPPSTARHLPASSVDPLPSLLHTPTGLALLEIQGTLNVPSPNSSASDSVDTSAGATPVGELAFPDYVPGSEDQGWMKRVWLYVGEHQRLTGEVKKLKNPLGVIRKRENLDGAEAGQGGSEEEVEVVEIVEWKIVFGTRPEPVGGGTEG
ncbi:hypothetical protein MMC20_004029 [Loxospora ochrophaea]|nr:hypothetical protein [Loxospora ochrophaea]